MRSAMRASFHLPSRDDFGKIVHSILHKGDGPVQPNGDDQKDLRTRRCQQRQLVLNTSSPSKMLEQVKAVLKRAGLKVEDRPMGKLKVTWPMETDIDAPEAPNEPLCVEVDICKEQGVKFRRITGPDNIFRRNIQTVLALIYCQWGW